MDRPGRNDPCYCGSGKKYKQCHMPSDLAADRAQRVWADAARELRLEILEFAGSERFEVEAGEAAVRYWNGLYTPETLALMSPSESERFLDWFAFDSALPSTGGRVVDLFLSEKRPTLSQEAAELLDLWSKSEPMSGYELRGYEGQTLRLKEFISGKEIELFEPGGHGSATTGSIILGRPVSVHDHLEFFSTPAYIPTEEVDGLSDKIATARDGDHSGSNADFLRRHNTLFIHHALERAKAAGRPPVARLDPRYSSEVIRQRMRHERVRIKGPSGATDNTPQVAQTHRKAI